AERGSSGFFDIDQEFGGVIEAYAGVEREHARCGFFIIRAQTVLAAVVGVEGRMSLEDKIHLTGEPEAGILEVRKHGLSAVVGRICRGSGGGTGLGRRIEFRRGARVGRRLLGQQWVRTYESEGQTESENLRSGAANRERAEVPEFEGKNSPGSGLQPVCDIENEFQFHLTKLGGGAGSLKAED